MIETFDLTKQYQDGANNIIHALKDINLLIPDKGLIFVSGKSGSGKSTLLNMLGLIEKPTTGVIKINGRIADYHNRRLCNKIRKDEISFVFQDYNLLNDFSVIDNIRIVGLMDNERIAEILKIVGLEKQIHTAVRYLSGGEKQRLAIARALSKKGKILLLDEPTGNLDEENSQMIFHLLRKLSLEKLIIVVTHDTESTLRYADKVIELKNGMVTNYYDNRKGFEYRLIVTDPISDQIIPIVQSIANLMKQGCTVTEIDTDHHPQKITVDKDSILGSLIRELKKYEGKTITIRTFFDEKPADEPHSSFDNINLNAGFDFWFQLKYALRLVWLKKIRFLLTLLIFTISMFLVFIHSNIVFFNDISTISNVLEQKNDIFYPTVSVQMNENTKTIDEYRSGSDLYQTYYERFADGAIPYFVSGAERDGFVPGITNNIEIHTNILTDLMIVTKADYEITGSLPVNEGEILITDFVAQYAFHTENAIGKSLILQPKQSIHMDSEISFTVSGIIGTDYSSQNVFTKYLEDPEYYIKNHDKLISKYVNCFITKETYIRSFADRDGIHLPAANFFLSNESSRLYAMNSLRYHQFSDQVLIFGRKPNQKNEVVLSADFASSYYNPSNPEEILGKYFTLKDLKNSPNKTYYQEYLNVYDISSGFTVVGLTEDESSDVFVHEDFYKELTQELFHTYVDGIKIVIEGDDIAPAVSYLSEHGIRLDYNYLKPAYDLISVSKSSFQNVLFFLEIAFLLISCLSLFLYCISNVNAKSKEISIMKSLGITNRKISGVFFMQNLFQTILGSVFSIVLGIFGFQILNRILQNEDVLNIDYSLLIIEPISYLLIVFLSLTISLLGTVIPFIQIMKNDISISIKNS